MPLGTVVWSDKRTFSHSIPVYPSVATFDALTIPPGLTVGTANIIVAAMSYYDTSKTAQVLRADALSNRGAALQAVPASGVAFGLTGVAGGVLSDDGSNMVFGGAVNPQYGIGAFPEGDNSTPGFIFPRGSINSGVTLRVLASTATHAVTADFCVTAAVISGSGVFPVPGFPLNQILYAASPNLFDGVSSGSITTTPDPVGKSNIAFIAAGAEADANVFVTSQPPPDFALDSHWANIQVASIGKIWAGLGVLLETAIPPATTVPYSVFIPSADYAPSLIWRIEANLQAASPSRVMIVG